MTLELDLTGVDAWEGTMILTPGDHPVEVVNATEGTSTGGHPQLELEMRATGGEQKGGQIRDWIVVTPQSAGRVKQMLLALGVGAEGKVKIEAADLVGKHCQIVVRNEPDREGKDRSRVKAYQQATAAAAAPSSNGAAKSDDSDLPF